MDDHNMGTPPSAALMTASSVTAPDSPLAEADDDTISLASDGSSVKDDDHGNIKVDWPKTKPKCRDRAMRTWTPSFPRMTQHPSTRSFSTPV